MKLTIPAVRFIRCYDAHECRMGNIWMKITSQDQLENEPIALELCVTAQTVSDVLEEIYKRFPLWLNKETIDSIAKASDALESAKDSTYEVM